MQSTNLHTPQPLTPSVKTHLSLRSLTQRKSSMRCHVMNCLHPTLRQSNTYSCMNVNTILGLSKTTKWKKVLRNPIIQMSQVKMMNQDCQARKRLRASPPRSSHGLKNHAVLCISNPVVLRHVLIGLSVSYKLLKVKLTFISS